MKALAKYIFVTFTLLLLHACTDGNNGGVNIASGGNISLGDEAFYSFDETEGATAFNSSSDIFHGEIVAASRSIGKVNNSLYFGADLPSYVMFEPYYDLSSYSNLVVIDFPTNEISVEAWIKFESLDPQQAYHFFGTQVGGIRSFKMEVIDSQFRFILFADSSNPIELVRTNYTFGVDVWHHVAFTFDGSTSRFYIDGILNNESNIIGSIKQVHNKLYLGGTLNDGSTSFPGYIDELRFSLVLRTPQEIDAYYQSTK